MQPSIIKGSVDWFAGQIDKEINPKLSFDISSYIQVYSIQDIFTQEFYKEGKINYPFITYQIRQLKLDYTRMGSLLSRKQGQTLFDIDNQLQKSYVPGKTLDSVQGIDFLPAIVEVAITFITNTPQQMDEFSINWLYLHQPELSGFFSYENIEIPVTAIVNTELSFPEAEHEDNGLVYRQEFTCELLTHIGTLKDITLVKALKEQKKTLKEGNFTGSTIKLSL